MGTHAMPARETVVLKRDCEATRIPDGGKVGLKAGTRVEITQSLGGTYTVLTEQGLFASIAGGDADALGKEASKPKAPPVSEGPASLEDRVWGQLRQCYDPEIPHNIVDLGLVYACKLSELPEGGTGVAIRMTLTAPGCGMGDWLSQDVKSKVLSVDGVKEAVVEVVFEPPWDKSMINPKLKPYLGL